MTQRPFRTRFVRHFASAGVLAIALVLVLAGCDWYQFGGGPLHSGFSPETSISAANVNQLRQRWQVTLPAQPGGSPAVVSGVQTPQGKKTLAFVTTQLGTLLAYDAKVGGAPVWQANHPAGTCRVHNATVGCFTTSSPAVDPDARYVFTYGLDGRVHKHAIGTGTEITSGGWPVPVTRKGYDEKGSSALAIATAANGHSYLYATTASYPTEPGDTGDYQGHVMTVDLATGAVHYFNSLCSNQDVLFGAPPLPDCPQTQSGIWARSAVTYDRDTDKVYVTTGNGPHVPSQHHWGNSVLALRPNGTGNAAGDPLDSYTPTNFQALNDDDRDLGSTTIAVLPTPSSSRVRHLGLQGGKDEKLRLLNLDDLSSQQGLGHLGGEVGPIINVPQGGLVYTAPTVWSNPGDDHTWVFIPTRRGLSALRLDVDGAGNPSLKTMWVRTTNGTNGSALLQNGLLFVASSRSVIAYDAVTGKPLWFAPLGAIHWQSPVIANGQLFIEDEDSHLTMWSR